MKPSGLSKVVVFFTECRTGESSVRVLNPLAANGARGCAWSPVRARLGARSACVRHAFGRLERGLIHPRLGPFQRHIAPIREKCAARDSWAFFPRAPAHF